MDADEQPVPVTGDGFEPDSIPPPGVGPAGTLEGIRRRPEPLWVIGFVIALPLLAVLVVYLVRLLFG